MKKLLLISAFMASLNASAVEIIAHRGENSKAPENSLEAQKLAWDAGVKMVEGDFHITDAGEIVCIHTQKDLEKLAASRKKIAELDASDFASLTLTDNPKWKDFGRPVRIPTLDEVFAAMPKGAVLVLEIKSYNADFAKKMEEARKKHGIFKKRILIIAFNHDYIKDLNERAGPYDSLLLYTLKEKDGKVTPTSDEVISKCKELNARGVNLGSKTKLLDQTYVSAIKKAGLEISVWTVNDIDEAKRLAALGVDYITTDHASDFAKKLR